MIESDDRITTKLYVAVDALGNPLRVILSAGQIADIEQAEALIKDQPAEFVVADKDYDSDAFVEIITAQGSQVRKTILRIAETGGKISYCRIAKLLKHEKLSLSEEHLRVAYRDELDAMLRAQT